MLYTNILFYFILICINLYAYFISFFHIFYIYLIPFILHKFFRCKDTLINYLSDIKRKLFY